jgi:hypothetical protein
MNCWAVQEVQVVGLSLFRLSRKIIFLAAVQLIPIYNKMKEGMTCVFQRG